jgi:Domain of unknown function (DUF4082)/PEP-CTERM motif
MAAQEVETSHYTERGTMRILFSIVAATVAWTACGQGTFEAVTSYTNASATSWDGTAGGTFQVTRPESLTALGCFDYVFGLNPGTIQVGLWDDAGNLIASNTISSDSPLVNQSRYQSITPVPLDPGQLYHLGAYSTNGTINLDVAAPSLGGSVVTAAQITLADSARAEGGFFSPVSVPSTPGALYLGANFQFQDRVPEPSSGLLVGLAGLLFLVCRRWGFHAPNAS